MQYMYSTGSKDTYRLLDGRDGVSDSSHLAYGGGARCELQPPQRFSISEVQSGAGAPLLVPSSHQHVSLHPCSSRLSSIQSTENASAHNQAPCEAAVHMQYPTANQLIDRVQIQRPTDGEVMQ